MSMDSVEEAVSNRGTTREPIELTITGLMADLKNGITRCKDDTGYDPQRGSIEEKYGLTKTEVKEIFKDPNLVGLKVKVPKEPRYKLINDTAVTDNTNSSIEKGYGLPSKAAGKRLKQETF